MRSDRVDERYLEDIAVGQSYRSMTINVDRDGMIDFAAEFDPQPFHVDAEAARTSFFGELVASGWYTAALTMRLLVESDFKPAGGLIGAGFDEFSFPRPVTAGDDLYLEAEVLDVRESKSRPQQGIVKARITTKNQRDEPVLVYVVNLIVQRRPA
ncbi:MAG TPA: MaoC family dehydratase [Burkholderiales bacterium]|nr:MaoC family dehydratase [Burkholderiales bacterium]